MEQSMEPRIESISEKKLIGKNLRLSLVNNRTGELWRSFMPRRNEIKGVVSTNLYSLQVYEAGHFINFDPEKEFVKWALCEVENFDHVPADMQTFIVTGGLYAVFRYKGSSKDTNIFEYIFSKWLPGSNFVLDNRPHFEILKEMYKNEDPDSEEEIWIPIKQKQGRAV